MAQPTPGNTAQLPRLVPHISEGDNAEAVSSELGGSLRSRPSQRIIRTGSTSNLSSSYNRRTRSYFHHAAHGTPDQFHYSSQGVREQTQVLASWALNDSPPAKGRPGLAPSSPSDSEIDRRWRADAGWSDFESQPRTSSESARRPPVGEEAVFSEDERQEPAGSALSELFRQKKQPLPRTSFTSRARDSRADGRGAGQAADVERGEATESTPLLPGDGNPSLGRGTFKGASKAPSWGPSKSAYARLRDDATAVWYSARHPERWDFNAAFQGLLGAVSAVLLGLLLNVLDALSYGMILFPLGEPLFEKTGPDGIAMFYVSCIVSQITYSLGGSSFKGGVGSEMIEVVPFMHKMAYLILDDMGPDDPEAVLATVIASYALSSILTGAIFLLLGSLRLGNLISFFPRSILLGCIGGVGVFLVLTGLEVSASLGSSIEWGLQTLQRLIEPNTLVLWVLPLVLSVSLMIIRKYLNHPVVMPAFFLAIVGVFYLVVGVLPNVGLPDLRKNGWVFQAPEADVPFYNFYSYYKFDKINWNAISLTVPTMFALSFFGIIHVPINVPALGIAVQQEDVHINRELFGHGVSNALSGLVGSIQNYLVFANSRLFIQNGGNSRWAGMLLALGTAGIWVAGPAMIGYIPIVIVGTLIFMLGIEMIQEALWDTFGKLHTLEYLMILAITVVMGFYDFVAGIVLGIILACLIFVVQTSRVSAIRAMYSGTVVESTVRRHPVHRRFLAQIGGQIKVAKLAGYLFFGSIVAVEKRVRNLIREEAFSKQPIRYLILDFRYVSGLDFSAAEAFVRMNRVLRGRDVEMVLSGVSVDGEVGQSLAMVGLLETEENEPPKIFEDLNQALESCENELLLAFKQRSDLLARQREAPNPASSLAIPQHPPTISQADAAYNSPRSNQVARAATTALSEHAPTVLAKAQPQPLPLILQAFKDATSRDADFWRRAAPYFRRATFSAGAVLHRGGEATAEGLYLLEEGALRAEHDLEQGRYSESMVAGTTCGELPFFAETGRTATVVAEDASVAWLLDRASWRRMEAEAPDLAMEILRVAMKLTSERMNSITSYVLVVAS